MKIYYHLIISSYLLSSHHNYYHLIIFIIISSYLLLSHLISYLISSPSQSYLISDLILLLNHISSQSHPISISSHLILLNQSHLMISSSFSTNPISWSHHPSHPYPISWSHPPSQSIPSYDLIILLNPISSHLIIIILLSSHLIIFIIIPSYLIILLVIGWSMRWTDYPSIIQKIQLKYTCITTFWMLMMLLWSTSISITTWRSVQKTSASLWMYRGTSTELTLESSN